MRPELGEDKYRMGVCYLFATMEANDEEVMEMLKTQYEVTEERQPKILMMMLSHCIKNWPKNLNETV